ncbi:MAG: gliding motility-associated C-terminal domain-containing protein [Bacteroidales bacterium]|jgi:gliding motility-associated-like protein|nr:gliding motility-associated C-terminal domain-containing protein [Bacteroidales bacterium]
MKKLFTLFILLLIISHLTLAQKEKAIDCSWQEKELSSWMNNTSNVSFDTEKENESWVNNTGMFSRYHPNKWSDRGLYKGFSPEDELLQHRTKDSKTFSNGNGENSYFLVGDLHYSDDLSNWCDIDLSIINNTEDQTAYKYSNTTNKFKTYYSEFPDKGILVNYQETNFILGKDYSFYFLDNDQNIIHYPVRTDETLKQKDYRTLIFSDFYPDIDYEITQLGRGIESGFWLHSKNAFQSISEGMIMVEQLINLPENCFIEANGKIRTTDFTASSFIVKFADGTNAITFEPVVLFDGAYDFDEIMKSIEIPHIKEEATDNDKITTEDPLAEHRLELEYKVVFKDGLIKVQFYVPVSWLNDPERIYPVFIDPEFTIGYSSTATSTAYYTLYNTYYHDSRWEFLLTSTELASVPANSEITAAGLLCSSAPGRVVANARIDLNNSAWTAAWVNTGWTECYFNASLPTPTVSNTVWSDYVFNTPTPTHLYDPTNGGIIVRLTRDGTTYSSGGGHYVISTTAVATSKGMYSDSNDGTYPFNAAGIDYTTAVRPSIKLVYTEPPANLVPETGSETYTMCFGTLADSGGENGNYADNSNGYAIINPNNTDYRSKVSGTITCESGSDYLTIYNGAGTGGTILWGGSPHGSGTGCETFTVPEIISTVGPLTVQFNSNGSTNCEGFILDVECVNFNPCLDISPMNCGTEYSGTLGTEYSFYNSYTGCTNTNPGEEVAYSFTPMVSGEYTISATVTAGSPSFYMMSSCSNSGTNIIGSCWNSGDETVTLTVGTTYYIIVDNQSSTEDASYSILIECLPVILVPQTGNATYTGCDFTVYDHAGPTGNYANNCNGYVIVYSNDPSRLFQISGTYSGETCCDYLRIYDGAGTASPSVQLWGGLFGSQTIPPLIASSGIFTISFTSDGSSTGSGFVLDVECVPYHPCLDISPIECGIEYSGTVSTEYNSYDSYTGCTNINPGEEDVYSFTPMVSGEYTLTATATSGNPSFYLMSSCGDDGTNIIGSCWNSGDVTATLNVGTTYYIIVDNQSDTEDASYSILIECLPVIFVPQTGNATYTGCSFTVYDHAGPTGNYANYCNGYVIIYSNDPNSLFQISGTYSGETCCDYLRIYDGAGTTSPSVQLWGGLFGNQTIPPLIASSGAITISFTSDVSSVGPGFALEVECIPYDPCLAISPIGCLTTYSGTLGTDDNHWSSYPGCSNNTPGNERVYSFVPPITGEYIITATAISGDPDFFLMTGECGNGGTNIIGDCWDDGIQTVNMTSGTTYYLLVDNRSDTEDAAYSISIDCPGPCRSAITMECDVTYSGNLATTGSFWSSYTSCSYTANGGEQVFEFTVPVTGSYTFATTTTAGDPDFYPMSSCGNTGTNLYNACWGSGNITLSLTGGQTIYIIADLYGSSPTTAGAFTMRATCPEIPILADITNNTGTTVLDCNTTSISLTAVGSGSGSTYTYSWSGGSSTSTAENTITEPGTYRVTVTNDLSATTTTSITITQNITPAIAEITNNTGDTLLTCNLTNINVEARAGASYQYEWNGGSSLNTAGNNFSEPGIYIVTVTGSNGCTSSDTITITQDIVIPTVSINTIGPPELTCVVSSVNVGATGGVSYLWDNGSSLNTAENTFTAPDTYTVTVTGANGCTNSMQIIINEDLTIPVAGITNNSGTNIITCASTTISLTATGGTTYEWSNSVFTATNLVNNAGTYIVTVTGANGCTAITSTDITQVDELPNITITPVPSSTNLNCNFSSINLVASGANSYIWDSGASTTSNYTVMQPGTYSVTGTNISGCSNYARIVIGEDYIPPTLTINNNSGTTTLNCNNDVINIGTTGGIIYNWSDGITVPDRLINSPGSYTITITGANGCTSSGTINITEDFTPPQASITNNTGTNTINCTTSNISLTATGGGTYLWNNTASSPNIIVADAGNYIVTVTGANGCSNVSSVNISEDLGLPTINIVNNSGTNVLNCNTPSISLTATGGVSYSWTGDHNDANITIISPGTWNVATVGANGCTDNVNITISSDFTPPTVNITNQTGTTVLDCNNSHINVVADGGVSYIWSNSVATAANSISAPGTYIVTVTGANGCENTAEISITQPPVLEMDVQTGQIICYGETTFVEITAAGGTPPYSGVDRFENIAAGVYQYTISDANECYLTTTVTIPQPEEIIISPEILPVSCYNRSDGQISLSVTGGGEIYTYAWDDLDNSTTPYLFDLPEGSWTVLVTDQHGCTATETISLIQPDTLILAINVTDASCYGFDDGYIDISRLSGGTEPYNFEINGSLRQLPDTFPVGNYHIKLYDSRGCEFIINTAVLQPNEITVNSSVTNIKCYGNNSGTISLDVNGGTEPYSIRWNIPEIGANITNLPAGEYSVVITDRNGCSLTDQYLITQPDSLGINYQLKDVSCYNYNDGAIKITSNGGTTPYNYSVLKKSNELPQTNYNTLKAGEYILKVIDDNGCIITEEVYIGEPEELTAYYEVTNPSCIKSNNGEIIVNTEGGIEPYMYTFNNIPYNDIPHIEGLREGVYTIEVIDANFCSVKLSNIKLTDGYEECIQIPNAFSPNGDGINDVWLIDGIQYFPEASILIFNRWGQEIFSAQGKDDPWSGKYNNSLVPAGTYMYIITLHDEDMKYSGTVSVVY